MVCDLCGSRRFIRVIEKNGYAILECLECSLVQADVADNVEDIYNREGYFSDVSTGMTFQTSFLDERSVYGTIPLNERTFDLYNAFPEGIRSTDFLNKSVLEIGPSPGGGTMRYLTAMSLVEGLEISERAATHLQRLGFGMHCGRIGEVRIDRRYDVILAYEVVEHLREPKKAFKAVFDLLEPGGKFILSTGNARSLRAKMQGARWSYYLPPQHLYYFSDSTISRYLEEAGFQALNIRIHKYSLWSKEQAVKLGFPNTRSRIFLALVNNLTNGMTVYAIK